MSELVKYRVPIGDGKPGKMGRHFPLTEKSGNFEQTGKVRILQKSGNFRQFLVIFKGIVYYLLKWIEFSVQKPKTFYEDWKMAEILEKSRNFVSAENWNHECQN